MKRPIQFPDRVIHPDLRLTHAHAHATETGATLMRLVPTYIPDADYIDRQLDLETQLAAIRAEADRNPDPAQRCTTCDNPRSWGTGNCVSDANRPHLYPAEYAAITAHYAVRPMHYAVRPMNVIDPQSTAPPAA